MSDNKITIISDDTCVIDIFNVQNEIQLIVTIREKHEEGKENKT